MSFKDCTLKHIQLTYITMVRIVSVTNHKKLSKHDFSVGWSGTWSKPMLQKATLFMKHCEYDTRYLTFHIRSAQSYKYGQQHQGHMAPSWDNDLQHLFLIRCNVLVNSVQLARICICIGHHHHWKNSMVYAGGTFFL